MKAPGSCICCVVTSSLYVLARCREHYIDRLLLSFPLFAPTSHHLQHLQLSHKSNHQLPHTFILISSSINMASSINSVHPRGIPMPISLITTNDAEGKSIFTTPPDQSYPQYKLITDGDTVFADIHCSPCVPAELASTSSHYDLAATQDMIDTNRSITGLPKQKLVLLSYANIGFETSDLS